MGLRSHTSLTEDCYTFSNRETVAAVFLVTSVEVTGNRLQSYACFTFVRFVVNVSDGMSGKVNTSRWWAQP